MTVLFTIFVIFIAFYVRSLLGFGSALLSIPLLALVYPLKLVVPVEALLEVAVSLILLPKIYKYIFFPALFPLAIGGMLGSVIGTEFLQNTPNDLLKRLLALVILVSAVLLLITKNSTFDKIRFPKALGWFAGLIGGLFGGILGQSGPAFALYLATQIEAKHILRATLIGLFIIDYGWRVSILSYQGLVTKSVLLYGVILIPIIVLSGWLGSITVQKIDSRRFESLVLVLVALAGCLNFFS